MATTSEYLQYLPAALQAEPSTGDFLRAFHRLLSGPEPGEADDGGPWGIEQLLDNIHTFFLPGAGLPEGERAPEEFLPWLAGWVATSLREDWDAETKRRFIQKVPALYPRRGTLDCLRQLLTFFLGEDQPPPIIKEDGDKPFYFSVRLRVPSSSPESVGRSDRTARTIIDREKPAHTFYDLIIESPAMQIIDLPSKGGILLGVNTLLGIVESTGTK